MKVPQVDGIGRDGLAVVRRILDAYEEFVPTDRWRSRPSTSAGMRLCPRYTLPFWFGLALKHCIGSAGLPMSMLVRSNAQAMLPMFRCFWATSSRSKEA